MAGGVGSRFWPLSRKSNPKQFLDVLGIGKSFLQLTFERFQSVCENENIYIVTNKDYVQLVKEQLPQIKDHQILAEPERRNTAPCIAYVANKINAANPKASLFVSPADHLILNNNHFIEYVKKAFDIVEKNDLLLTFGIKPSRPDTGYGYIKYNKSESINEAFKVAEFAEKPSLDKANEYVKSGEYLWNSGMFVWNIKTILDAFKQNLPEIAQQFGNTSLYNTKQETDYIEKLYAACQNISIDYGIMEKAKNVYVIPANIDWSDLGTWASLYDVQQKTKDNNVLIGANIHSYDSKNNIVKTYNDKVLVLKDLDNYIVVDTPDALLIAPRAKEQEIKQITEDLSKKGMGYIL